MQKKTEVTKEQADREESKEIVRQILKSVEAYACAAIDNGYERPTAYQQIDEAYCFVRQLGGVEHPKHFYPIKKNI